MATNNLINNDTANYPNELAGRSNIASVDALDEVAIVDVSDTSDTANGTLKKSTALFAYDTAPFLAQIQCQTDHKLADWDPATFSGAQTSRGLETFSLAAPGGGTLPPLTDSGLNFPYLDFVRGSSNGASETNVLIAEAFDSAAKNNDFCCFFVGQHDLSALGSGKMAYGGWNGPGNVNAAIIVVDKTLNRWQFFNETASPTLTGTTPLVDNQVYVVCIKKNNNDVKVYIDGVEEPAFAITYNGDYPDSDSFNIGFEYDTGPAASDYLTGRMYRVLYYNFNYSELWVKTMSRNLLQYYSNPYTAI